VIPVCVLPDTPVVEMVVACAHHHSQKGFEFYQPELGVEHSVPRHMFGWRYHGHVSYSLVIPQHLPLLTVPIAVEHEEGHSRVGYWLEHLHLEPIVGHHDGFNLLTDRSRVDSL